MSSTQPVTYQWYVSDVSVANGTIPPLIQGAEHTVVYTTTWPHSPMRMKFSIDTQNKIQEESEVNNTLLFGSHDLTLSYWVETELYRLFNSVKNTMGSYSFEDWMRQHISMLNTRLNEAKYPTTPHGAGLQIRVDKIVIGDQLDGQGPMTADLDLYVIDGRWQTTDADPTNNRGNNGFYQEYVTQYTAKIDWGLVHEMVHQLGAPDLYRMNLPEAPPNNGIQITKLDGTLVKRPDFLNNGITFPFPDLMGGGNTSPYKNETMLSAHTAAGLSSTIGYRRGHFAEYYYDMPQTTKIRVLDRSGYPLKGSTIKLFQRHPDTELFDIQPEHLGTADTAGVILLTNHPATAVTTATGHTLKPNPFGTIVPSGNNGMMIVQARLNNTEGYGFLLLHDLNMAYWSGKQTEAIIDIYTSFPSSLPPITPLPSPPICSTKYQGDADCNNSNNLVDFEIWRKEYFSGCSQSMLASCHTDDDADGNPMDANFNGPGSLHPVKDTVVNLLDFEIWRKGFFL